MDFVEKVLIALIGAFHKIKISYKMLNKYIRFFLKNKLVAYLLLLLFVNVNFLVAQTSPSIEGNIDNLPIREYNLTIDEKMVNITGKKVMGMAINSSIPGPTLRFTEGEYAVIHVKNNLKMETSVIGMDCCYLIFMMEFRI